MRMAPWLGLALLACSLVGCAAKADMSPQDAANFKGGPSKPMTPEQQSKKDADIKSFQEQFAKAHPNVPQPPAGR